MHKAITNAIAGLKEKSLLASQLSDANRRIGELEDLARRSSAELAQLRAAEARLNALEGILKENGMKPGQIIDGEAFRKAFSEIISIRAADQIAELGFPSSGLPKPSLGDDEGAGSAELRKRFSEITDPSERARFYSAHERELTTGGRG
jgi:hypothetical protein